MSLTASHLLFQASALAAVFWMLGMRRPHLAGRRPLAIYDQLTMYAVLTATAGIAVSRAGLELWLVGASSIAGGIAATRLIDHLEACYPVQVQENLRAFYFATPVVCFASALATAELIAIALHNATK